MRRLISALAVAGLLLAAAPIAAADDETTTTTPTTTTTTTEAPTETTTTTESSASALGQHDLHLAGLTLAPGRKTYSPGDTITATVIVGGAILSTAWGLEAAFPAGLTVTGHTGLVDVEVGESTVMGFGEGMLGHGETATVTVTFRADAEISGAVTFTGFGSTWSDYNEGNNTLSRDIVVTKGAPAPPKPAPQPELADTGASAAVPLLAGCVLLLVGGGLLVAVRRKRT